MPDYTNLKIPGSAGDAQLTDQLRSNVCMFLDWALLNMGYFMNATTGTFYPPYGISPSKLRPSDDFRWPSGIVWDAPKTNWCWENGIEFSSQPIQVTGVYINGNLNTSGYNINYPLGRVVFNNPVNVNSNIQVEYSYKYYNIYPDTVQWFKQLTQGTWKLNDPQFNSQGSGIWSIFPDSRSQLPAIVVEISPRLKHSPLGLGGGQWIWKDVLVHVFSETDYDRDNLIDILSYQSDKRVFLFDKNIMSKSGVFPLNAYGYLINPSSTYPNLINNYVWRDLYIQDVDIQTIQNNPQSIFYGVAKWTAKVNMPDII